MEERELFRGQLGGGVKVRTNHSCATLDSFPFKWQRPGSATNEALTANQIDALLGASTNLVERLTVWKASKESGVALKPGLVELRDLRNRVAREMGFSSFYALQVAHFGMSVPELRALTDQLVRDTKPLYDQLHCWARYKLAKRYGQPVPKLIPAHWLGNRWGQEWPGLVASVDLDPLFQAKQAEWLVRQAVNYGESMGLPRFPASFWSRSDLYELPADATRKKNTHASAWDMNLQGDVRSLENVKPDFDWFGTAHHEMGHVFYQLSYDQPGVPMVLRTGASPAFHEARPKRLRRRPSSCVTCGRSVLCRRTWSLTKPSGCSMRRSNRSCLSPGRRASWRRGSVTSTKATSRRTNLTIVGGNTWRSIRASRHRSRGASSSATPPPRLTSTTTRPSIYARRPGRNSTPRQCSNTTRR